MKYKILLLLIPLALIVSSCLRSGYNFVSYREPGVSPKLYKKVCIFADFDDPFAKRETELEVGKHLFELGMNTVPAFHIMPPTRERTNEEIHQILVDNGVDAFIRISIENIQENTAIVPARTTSTTVVSEKVVKDDKNDKKRDSNSDKKSHYKGSREKITTEQTTVTNSPGYEYKYMTGDLKVSLIDVGTSQLAFVQNIHSGRYSPQFKLDYLRYGEVQEKIALTIEAGLRNDGFLPPKR